MITSRGWDGTYKLVYEGSEQLVEVGDRVTSALEYIVEGGRAPHKAESSGRVYVRIGDSQRDLYPTVLSMKWIKVQ